MHQDSWKLIPIELPLSDMKVDEIDIYDNIMIFLAEKKLVAASLLLSAGGLKVLDQNC